MRVAFIGLGNMGKPMSRNLIKAGHAVHGFDISPDAVATLQQGGCRGRLGRRRGAAMPRW